MTRIYREVDVCTDMLSEQKIAVLGYGSQGRAHAMNLRDRGHDLALGLRPDGTSHGVATTESWDPCSVREAVEFADIVAILVPDMVQGELYREAIEPHLSSGKALLFAHGFAIHYEQVLPREDVDVVMVAPKAPGALVRRQFERGEGVPCLLAVHRDATGRAFDRALAYAHGIGGTRAGVFETTFEEETETDLFGEQAVLCGGVTELVQAGFDTLVRAGYSPQVAYFECMHELKLIVDLLYEGGLDRMHTFVSETAQYGDLTRGSRVVDDTTRERMRTILTEIRNGTFAREWIHEHEEGRPNFRELKAKDLAHPIEAIGRELRSNMSWLPTPQPAGEPAR